MNPVELNAYKLRIENPRGISTLDDIVRQLLTLGEFPGELLSAVIGAIKRGQYISSVVKWRPDKTKALHFIPSMHQSRE